MSSFYKWILVSFIQEINQKNFKWKWQTFATYRYNYSCKHSETLEHQTETSTKKIHLM